MLTNSDDRDKIEFLSHEGELFKTAEKLLIIGEKVNPSESYSDGFSLKE